MKTKITSVEKVYAAAKKLFKVGKELPVSKIAKAAKMGAEGARLNVIKLVKLGKIKRDSAGHITNVK